MLSLAVLLHSVIVSRCFIKLYYISFQNMPVMYFTLYIDVNVAQKKIKAKIIKFVNLLLQTILHTITYYLFKMGLWYWLSKQSTYGIPGFESCYDNMRKMLTSVIYVSCSLCRDCVVVLIEELRISEQCAGDVTYSTAPGYLAMLSCGQDTHHEGTVWPGQQVGHTFCGEKNGIQ